MFRALKLIFGGNGDKSRANDISDELTKAVKENERTTRELLRTIRTGPDLRLVPIRRTSDGKFASCAPKH